MQTIIGGRRLGNNRRSFTPKRLSIGRFLNRSTVAVPAVPLDVSVSPIVVANPWIMASMLCNGPSPTNPPQIPNGIGDCWWAAAARRAALAAASVGRQLWASEADMIKAVLQGYASTGFDLNNPDQTDQGTDPTQGDAFMKSTGLLCSDGSYDKIGATLGVNPKDLEEVYIAFNLAAGNMTVGVSFPEAWETADVWDQNNSAIVGGHEIAAWSDLLITPRGIQIDSWGEKHDLTEAGLAMFGTDITINITPDAFGPGSTNIAGFDVEALQAALKAQGAI